MFNNANLLIALTSNGDNDDIKTWPLTDLSGYFVIGFDSSTPYYAKIWKYTFSSSSAQCQTITNINKGYGHLMVSNNQFFVLGVPSASPYNLQIYKITFLSTSVDWANQITCTSGTWSASISESLLSSDQSTIYSFFLFGPSLVFILRRSVCGWWKRGNHQIQVKHICIKCVWDQLWTETTW